MTSGPRRSSFLASVGYAVSGIVRTAGAERNMRIHLRILACMTLVELVIRPPLFLVILVMLVSALVLGLELVNTAVESIVDLVLGKERHPLAKHAKDAAAGAVLTASLAALGVASYLLTRMWPLAFHLWSTIHWFGALLNGSILIATMTVLWRARGHTVLQSMKNSTVRWQGGKADGDDRRK